MNAAVGHSTRFQSKRLSSTSNDFKRHTHPVGHRRRKHMHFTTGSLVQHSYKNIFSQCTRNVRGESDVLLEGTGRRDTAHHQESFPAQHPASPTIIPSMATLEDRQKVSYGIESDRAPLYAFGFRPDGINKFS